MKKSLLILHFIVFSVKVLYAQTYQIQGQTAPCASNSIPYSLVAVGNSPGISGCTISWTVTGGTFSNTNGQTTINNGGTSVDVIWNNNASSTSGKIEATLSGSGCNSTIAKTYTLDVTIKTIGSFSGISVNGTNYNCNSSISVPCGTTPITFATSTVANATNYQWIVPSGWTVSSSNNTSITVIPSQNLPSSGSVSIRATRVDCAGLQSTCSINFTRPTPVVNAVPSSQYPPPFCAGESKQLTVTGANLTSMIWSANNGFTVSNVITTANNSVATITAPPSGTNASGTITVTAVSSSCGNGNSISIPVSSIGTLPSVALISVAGQGMTVCSAGLNLGLIYNGVNLSTNVSYPLPFGITQIEWAPTSGNVYVVGNQINGGVTATAYANSLSGLPAQLRARIRNCTGWSEWYVFYVNVCSGFRFVYSPNPTSEVLTITAVPTEENKDLTIATEIDFEAKLLDQDGKVVRESKNQDNEKELSFDVKGLKAGTYYLHILYGKELEKHQIIISKSASTN
ncbi:T9SS type A sorting domain-containing protein [Thermoflexibacter ruber]|uniref:Por secretion system C-terminal sorting domain-containing protein n=1 Tax=Thermoflexibacter ruber TaxID=1003 RepID=A0A1I2IG87_9BACT|nr:T9SS type A sorting domain-containing protein [Thermoflexibacter ruber]SFF40650.1 Por secretion system C-terminal sorting domain-containing protein [Thermoflexibacter ruber]